MGWSHPLSFICYQANILQSDDTTFSTSFLTKILIKLQIYFKQNTSGSYFIYDMTCWGWVICWWSLRWQIAGTTTNPFCLLNTCSQIKIVSMIIDMPIVAILDSTLLFWRNVILNASWHQSGRRHSTWKGILCPAGWACMNWNIGPVWIDNALVQEEPTNEHLVIGST